ncbi:choline transporter-like protein 1 isoform X1 [Cyrtonyx montezumae]|uniref:choline transporter-like protein 1 isoform X1 n=1 Tax=Cyrtonyx montezumae TaxID=9017 RepID=UPI0032DB7DE9
MGCCSSAAQSSKREWKPLEDHSCTDLPWLLLFILFCIGMGFICGFTIATGAAARLLSGYDSYGNICGQKNVKVEGIDNSGLDFTQKKYVFFLDPCNIDLVHQKIKSLALCVSACPRKELKTLADVQKFAETNGSTLCSYELLPSEYTTDPRAAKLCPKYPVPESAPIPFFHRCAPVNISCYAKFAEALITFVSDSSVLHRLISGVMTSKEIIMGLCLLSLVLSMILMVIIRYISRALVWILTILVILGSLGGTGVLWWLYAKERMSASAVETQIAKENLQALLIYAISATVFTVILLLIMLIMRKRVALTIALFHVAGKVFIHLPLLVFQPFWTFFVLILFWTYWTTVLLFLGTTGNPVPNEEGFVEFRMVGPLKYMWWYHVVGLIWISEFILACQQMTVAGAVVTYYFTREKRNLPFTPILASVNRLVCYHLGTVAKGSFIITLVKIPRMILMYVHTQLKGKENACARCMLKACICCLWCLEKCLTYLNQNAYTATAINSTNFCTSAKDAFVILVENALRVAAINTVGDFMLFIGKVLIVCSTGLAGIMLLNYQQDYTTWVLPLIIVCLFAFLVAHCFLSIYEMVVDVLFLCFAIDTKYNDGSPGREFYMDKVLMEFVENSRKSMREAGRGGGAEGRELKPMVGADEEVAILQEFHFYFFSLFVFTDCTSSGEVFVLCITQDVLLFLFVSLPITWMAEFLSQLRPSPVKVR